MVYKNGRPSLKIFPFFITLCIFIVPFAFAQEDTVDAVTNELAPILQEEQVSEDGERDFFYEETSDGIVFVQRLLWDEVPYALRYDVVIEKQIEIGEQTEAVQWQLVNTINTKINMVEVSLLAGIYRYKVVVYNLFDMPELESKWFEINIIRAMKPKINSIFPEFVYLDEENTGIFRIRGKNISENAIYTLEISRFPEYTLTGFLVEKDNQNEWVDVQFNINASKVGEYILVIKNPSGFSSEKGYVVIETSKPRVVSATFGYVTGMMIPNDDIFTYFDTPFMPVGASAQISYLSPIRRSVFFGFELSVFWLRIAGEKDGVETSFDAVPVNVNFVCQVPLVKDLLFLDANVGFGMGFVHNMRFVRSDGTKSPSENGAGISMNAGVALQLYLYKNFYAEAKFNYILMMPDAVNFQMITRSISFGWRF